MVVRRHGRFFHAGFTLPELLTVLVVAGILASIAVPSFNYFVQSQRTKDASFSVFNSLNFARSEAIKRNADVTLTPVSGDWKLGWNITSSGTTLKTQPAFKGIKITSEATSLIYRKTGRVAEATKFELDVDATETSDHVRCVRTALSGLPRSAKGVCP